MKILFRNLEKSDLAKEIVTQRLQPTIEKFPDLRSHQVVATLSMENSPHKPGRDSFTVKILITGKRYRAIVLKKSGPNLYAALAEATDHLLERLNRYGDRLRVKRLHALRRAERKLAFA